MKVELDEKGNLKVSAETKLEAYALNKWSADYFKRVKTEVNKDRPVIEENLVISFHIQN